ncbi:MAG: anthrone oxygenase family protein [Cyanobacteria bacterium P01_G01_bin.19]
MMSTLENWRLPLILLASVGSAVTGGIFFAFSTFVMQALAKQPTSQGIATMKSINITVINPWFMAAFFAPAVAGILLSISLLFQWQPTIATYLLTASLLYLIGTVGVTVVGNIPLNDALAVVIPNSVKASTLWSKYLTDWTFWNHVRTAAALLAAILFALAIDIRSGLTT